jgi:hypothetical protein
MRKAYLKLSLIIHPDKLGRTFDQATKAFQALVSAFDRLSSPEVVEEVVSKGKNKVAKIARSNEGCYRTRVCCPRCKQTWSEGTLDGNPDYFYNFLMTGLKQFSCSTCLCEFGCMTALHKCPFCQGLFEYSPEDYHRKVTCGREKCASKPFGFFCYSTSDRVIAEVKKEVKAEHERRLKARESKQRRAKRMEGRGSVDEERAFLFGLTECCPRSGTRSHLILSYLIHLHFAALHVHWLAFPLYCDCVTFSITDCCLFLFHLKHSSLMYLSFLF